VPGATRNDHSGVIEKWLTGPDLQRLSCTTLVTARAD